MNATVRDLPKAGTARPKLRFPRADLEAPAWIVLVAIAVLTLLLGALEVRDQNMRQQQQAAAALKTR